MEAAGYGFRPRLRRQHYRLIGQRQAVAAMGTSSTTEAGLLATMRGATTSGVDILLRPTAVAAQLPGMHRAARRAGRTRCGDKRQRVRRADAERQQQHGSNWAQ